MAAYLGPELSLERFLFAPPHNLVRQAWQPREMTVGHLNADGYGLGWYRSPALPERFVSALPIWGDVNLPALGRSLHSSLWLGSVRGATPGSPSHPANSQPFLGGPVSFMHNGHLADFAVLRSKIRALLSPEIEVGIEGSTDSEYVFALLRQTLAESDGLVAGVRLLLQRLHPLLGSTPALLNLIVTNGTDLVALRHARGADAPSLYYRSSGSALAHATWVASEPLCETADWRAVPPDTLVVCHGDGAPGLQALS